MNEDHSHADLDFLYEASVLLGKARDACVARIAELESLDARHATPIHMEALAKERSCRLRIAEDFLHAGDLEWRYSDSEARLTARQDVLFRFVEEAVHLRLYGEAAPGGRDWDAWTADALDYLREHGIARRREDRP